MKLYYGEIEIITQGLPRWQSRVSSFHHISSSAKPNLLCTSQPPSGMTRKTTKNIYICFVITLMRKQWSTCHVHLTGLRTWLCNVSAVVFVMLSPHRARKWAFKQTYETSMYTCAYAHFGLLQLKLLRSCIAMRVLKSVFRFYKQNTWPLSTL